MNYKILIMLLCFFAAFQAAGHDGHEHSSGEVQPQKGGVLRTLETLHVELVQMNKQIKVYLFSKDTPPKPLDVVKYKVSAQIKYPRGKGIETIQLESKKDHWQAKVDAKGLHRFTFVFKIEQGGHNDALEFTIEPK